MAEHVSNSPAAELRIMSVLVVEDSVTLRFTLSEWLRLSGYVVLEAASADEAAILLKSVINIDLVITDVEMPGNMSGYDLALHIQNERPALPIIIVSGNASRKKFREIGFTDFFEKPYDFLQLANRVAQILPVTKGLPDE